MCLVAGYNIQFGRGEPTSQPKLAAAIPLTVRMPRHRAALRHPWDPVGEWRLVRPWPGLVWSGDVPGDIRRWARAPKPVIKMFSRCARPLRLYAGSLVPSLLIGGCGHWLVW